MKKNEIIVMPTIKGKQVKVVLQQELPYSTTYNMWVDNEYEGMITFLGKVWKVIPKEKSWLKGENCEEILEAALNAHYPNR